MNIARIRMAAVVAGVSLLVFAVYPSLADERPVKMKNLPKAVQKTVREQSKGAKLRGLSKEVENGKTYYEAELIVDGHGRDVLIDSTGAVVEVEEEVPLASVPPAVKATIEANADKILKLESITKGGKLEAYEAEVRKSGKRSEIKVSPEGKLISREQ